MKSTYKNSISSDFALLERQLRGSWTLLWLICDVQTLCNDFQVLDEFQNKNKILDKSKKMEIRLKGIHKLWEHHEVKNDQQKVKITFKNLFKMVRNCQKIDQSWKTSESLFKRQDFGKKTPESLIKKCRFRGKKD